MLIEPYFSNCRGHRSFIMRTAEPVTGAVTYHGEGPFWDAQTGRLLVMDMLAGEIVSVDLRGRHVRHELPSPVTTVIRRRTAGGFVVATASGLLAANESFSTFEPVADIIDDPSIRTNDGGCDPFGAFVIGTMAYDERPGAGAVYRVSPTHDVTELVSPVSISNGVQWSSAGERAYYIDTPTRRVDVFDVEPETGAWSGRRMHIDLGDAKGYPDGMAIDEEEGLWVALWGGAAVNHYDANGRFVDTISIPGVSQTSSCTFGGGRRDMLYITTSRQGLPDDDEPAAGAVFTIQTSIRGQIPPNFAG